MDYESVHALQQTPRTLDWTAFFGRSLANENGNSPARKELEHDKGKQSIGSKNLEMDAYSRTQVPKKFKWQRNARLDWILSELSGIYGNLQIKNMRDLLVFSLLDSWQFAIFWTLRRRQSQ